MVPKIDRPSDKSMLKNPQDKTIWLLWILLYNELIYLGGKFFELVLTMQIFTRRNVMSSPQ